jgi:acyl carrier protein
MLNERLARVIATTFKTEVGDINSETAPGNLKAWTSVGHLKLIMELEEEFGIRFRGSEIAELNSVGRIQAALERLKAI